jgi:hypothetical protein
MKAKGPFWGGIDVGKQDAAATRACTERETVRAANVAALGFDIGTRVRVVRRGRHSGDPTGYRYQGRRGVVVQIPCLPGFPFRYIALERTARERSEHTEIFAIAELEVIPLEAA